MSGYLPFCYCLLMFTLGPSWQVCVQYIHKHRPIFHQNTPNAPASTYNNYAVSTPERVFVYPYYPPVKVSVYIIVGGGTVVCKISYI